MNKRLRQFLIVAFVAFAIWLLVQHPHSPAVFVHSYTGHK